MFHSRPLLIPTSAFLFGIVFAEFVPQPTDVWIGLILCGFWIACFRGRSGALGFLAVFVGAGGLDHSLLRVPWDPSDLRWRLAGQTCLGSVRGTLVESPSIRLFERRGVWAERTLVRLEASAIRTGQGDWEPATGSLLVSTSGVPGEEFHRGAAVELEGVFSPPPGPAMRGLLDYRRFLGFQGIGMVLRCEAPADWRLQDGSRTEPPWDEIFLRWARRRLSTGLPDDESTRLIWAMLLGWKTALSGEVDDAFMESGTLHLFAISGLHVALVALALVQGLQLMRIPRWASGLLSFPLFWAYVAATGWQPSAVRSAVMCSVLTGAWALNRPSDLINSLALSALLILAWDPGQVFQAGFLLSFGVVGAMPLLQPPIEEFLGRIRPWKPDPLLPERLWGTSRRLVEWGLRWLLPALSNGLAALAASVPFTAHFFHLVSPVGVLVNLAAVPLGSLVLVAGLVSMTVPFGTDLWNASAWLSMSWLAGLARLGAEIPFGWFRVESPPVWIWIPYGLWFAVPALGGRLRGRGRRMWMVVAAASTLLAGAGVGSSARASRISVFPGGEAVLVEDGRRAVDWLLDAGDEMAADRLILPTLAGRGFPRLNAIVVSQPDSRHSAGFPQLVEALRPEVWLRCRIGGTRGPWKTMESAARRAGCAGVDVSAGAHWEGWDVLHPHSSGYHSRGDDRSLVLSGEMEGWRILMVPSLGAEGQLDLVRRMGGRLKSDLLLAGNPRSGGGLGPELLAAVRPRVVVVSGGPTSLHGKTPPAVRRRLRDLPARVYYTEELGGLEILFGDRLELRLADGGIVGVWSREPLMEPKRPDTTGLP